MNILCEALSLIALICVCVSCQREIKIFNENYDYTVKSGYYVLPSAAGGWTKKDALKASIEGDLFFVFTEDKAVADSFINTQQTLLNFLRKRGVNIKELKTYGTDYEYCFSESGSAYISLQSVGSWQHIIVTLQALWGDYTDYGYVYAVSNSIAEELGWQTDFVPNIDKNALDNFFAKNQAAIDLLYPTFTTDFSSEDTVNSCKALSRLLFSKIKLNSALKKDIDTQLDDYYSLLAEYAENNQIPFARQECRYAYYGENVLLRIMTTYAEFIIDANYSDVDKIYENIFSDYEAIYLAANSINKEITNAVESFGVEDRVGVIKIKWLDCETNAAQRLLWGRNGIYYGSTDTAYLASLFPYLHEYYHHIEYTIKQVNERTWQSQAFCELGCSYSQYSLLKWEKAFTQNEEFSKIFVTITGHKYQYGREDFYEAMDILCYITGYELDYLSGGAAINSFTRYLVDLFGENTVYNLMLYPETIEAVTAQTWEELATEWEGHIKSKYAEFDISDLLTQ